MGRLEKQMQEAADNDLKEMETKVICTRHFSEMHKYLGIKAHRELPDKMQLPGRDKPPSANNAVIFPNRVFV